MIRKNILNERGYEIPCLYNIKGNEKALVLISHGLGSSKESPTVVALIKKLEAHGIAYMAYDFPGHGESPVDGERFLVDNCIKDMARVEAYARELLPQGEIMYFSSSFGAYINILYLAKYDKKEAKSFLRAAAVNMPGIFKDNETREFKEALDRDGYFVLEEGYHRPLRVTKEFCHELEANHVLDVYRKGTGQIVMVHGDQDESASIDDAVEFAEKAGARLIIVEKGKHRLMDKGQMALVLEKAMGVYL